MSTSGELGFATWNLRWARPRSRATPIIRERLANVAPHIAVLTEATTSMLEQDWPYIEHGGVSVYPRNPADGAKVAIVSSSPMEVVDRVGDAGLPPGNFLAIDVETTAGPLRVIGVVVRYNQMPEYIDALPAALERTVTPNRTVLAGDFNLRMPATGLATRLEDALRSSGLTVHTAGTHAALVEERPLLDHIATTPSIVVRSLEVWPRHDPQYHDGAVEVSDHAGVAVTLQL